MDNITLNCFQIQDKEKEAVQFNEFLDHVMGTDNKRRGKARIHREFWDNQCIVLNNDRKQKLGITSFQCISIIQSLGVNCIQLYITFLY